MGRKKRDNIRKYFIYKKVENEEMTFCNIGNCKQLFIKDLLCNLRRHVKICHKDIYTQYLIDNLENDDRNVNKNEFETIKIKVNKNEIKKTCVDLVVNSGCSLNVLNTRGFRQITGPYVNAIKVFFFE